MLMAMPTQNDVFPWN